MEPRQAAPPGTSVYGADGELIGTIQSTEGGYIVVDSGGVPPVYYVPGSAIVEMRDDGAYLSVTAADAQHQGWSRAPESGESDDRVADGGSGYSAVQAEDSMDADHDALPVREGAEGRPQRPAATDATLERPSGETGPIQD